jgi:hypothetical protein
MKIGLVPMAAKPYHAGHDMLVRIAAKENDQVKLYVSTADRREDDIGISGDTMLYIWLTYIQDTLPSNVTPDYDRTSPVAKVYNELERAESEASTDVYTIYSDDEDIIRNYNEKSLIESAPNLLKNGQIIPRGISRQETIDISGTQMRDFLEDAAEEDENEFDDEDDVEEENDNKELFISFLPKSIQKHGNEIFDILKNDIIGESLIRKYVRQVLIKS